MIRLALQFTAYIFAIPLKKSVNLRNLPLSFCCAKPISSNNMMQKAFISLHILKYVVQVMLELDDHTDEIGHTKILLCHIKNSNLSQIWGQQPTFLTCPNMMLSNSYNGQPHLVRHFPRFRKTCRLSLIPLLGLQ